MEIEMRHTGQRINVDRSVAIGMVREGRAFLAGPIFDRRDMESLLGHGLRPVPMSAERLREAGI